MKTRRTGKTNLVPIGSVLQSSQKKTQLAFTVSSLRREWRNLVGEMLANQTRPKKTERGVLWVSVNNSALKYELSMMKPNLLEKINADSSTKYKDIKFIHEAVEPLPEKNETPSRQKFVRAPVLENETLESILERVKNLSKDLQKKS